MATLVTVHLLVNSDDESHVADALSGLLSETGMYPAHGQPATLLDWGYPRDGYVDSCGQNGHDYGKVVAVPTNYEEGEFYNWLT